MGVERAGLCGPATRTHTAPQSWARGAAGSNARDGRGFVVPCVQDPRARARLPPASGTAGPLRRGERAWGSGPVPCFCCIIFTVALLVVHAACFHVLVLPLS